MALSDQTMVAMGADLRLLVRTMSCTKEQLIQELASVDPEEVALLLDQWKDTADSLRALAKVIDEALARWLVSAILASR